MKTVNLILLAIFATLTYIVFDQNYNLNEKSSYHFHLRNMAMKNTSNLIRHSSNANLIDEITSGVESHDIADQENKYNTKFKEIKQKNSR